MGQLRDKRIVQDRIWLNPNPAEIPPYDFDYTYPITVYEAIKKDMSDNSSTLADELEAIYRLISNKQGVIGGGVPGNLLTFTGVEGQVSQTKVVRAVVEPHERSHKNLLSEKAIGDALDQKATTASLNAHISNREMHLSDIERTRWNGMAPLTSLNAHALNTTLHVSPAERARWNAKASQADFEDHVLNTNNPHNVTAHQAGTYTRKEIDDFFAALRETFFNYLNIEWDDRTNTAKLVNYHPANWNPNYILSHADVLPDVPDPSLIYFALKPMTDYTVNESNDVSIWIKRPGIIWHEVGSATMRAGDMVIKYPNTTMFVWVQGRFLKLFSGNAGDEIGGGVSDQLWRPSINSEGLLVWERSSLVVPPDPMDIKGKDGYTPKKGIDYFDGQDGVGVPAGGVTSDILIKLTDNNHDTTWRSLWDILLDLVEEGKGLPPGVVIWENIKDHPKAYHVPGHNSDGYMTQKAVTTALDAIQQSIVGLNNIGVTVAGLKADLFAHMNDFNNPHRVTPAMIGGVERAAFDDHIHNFMNPHAVTKDQIGLGNVDNTKDINKPISIPVQEALDEINRKLGKVANSIVDVVWNQATGKLDFKFSDNSVISVAMQLGGIESVTFDKTTSELVFKFDNGRVSRIPIESILQYSGSTGEHINVIIEDDNRIRADIIPSSITGMELSTSLNLRGAPTAVTQAVSDNSTRLATTEFVKKQVVDSLISYETNRGLSANMGRILNQRKADVDDVIRMISELSGYDVIDALDSTNPNAALSANMGRHLDLTKAPKVHTSPSGSTFGVATVALFGHARASNVDPLMDGTVFRGTDNGYYARADHRHPSDDSKMDKDGLINIDEVFEGNGEDSIGEFIGFTIEKDCTPDAKGAVNKVLFNIHYKYFKNVMPTVRISGVFKALMGNGMLITLRDPVRINVTRSHATIMFTMNQVYPSNSPCSLVYGNTNSKIIVTTR